jgi:Heavy metal binding domain
MNFSNKPTHVLGVLLLTAFVAAAACLYFDVPARFQKSHPASIAKQTYTCAMHPEVVQDHPGNCPKCGMALRPASAASAPQRCESHNSGCCAKPAAQALVWPPGQAPIDGYAAPVASPECKNHLHGLLPGLQK